MAAHFVPAGSDSVIALAPVFIAAGIVATGFTALRLLRPATTWTLQTFAYSTAVGLSLTMLALYLPLALTGSVHFGPALVLHGLALCAAARVAWTARRRRIAFGPVALLAIGASLFYLDVVCAQPFHNYDAKAIYGLKAKALLNEGSLDTPLFQDVDVVHYHPDYPLGLSLVMAYSGFVAEGTPADPLGEGPGLDAQAWIARYDAIDAYMPLTLLWVAAFVCLVASAASRFGAPRLAAASVLVIPLSLIAPLDIGASWRATPELPLALCLGTIALCVFDEDRATRKRLFIAATVAMGGMLLKSDCLIGLTAIALAAALLGKHGRRAVAPLSLAGGCLAGGLTVGLVRRTLSGAPYDENYLAALLAGNPFDWLARTIALPRAVWESIVSAHSVPFWAFLVLLAIPIAWSAGGKLRALAFAVSLHLLLCLAVFLVTPNHMHWHVRAALVRLWSQMAGPACCLVVFALGRLLGGVSAYQPTCRTGHCSARFQPEAGPAAHQA